MSNEVQDLIAALDHNTLWIAAKQRLIHIGEAAQNELIEALNSRQGRKTWLAANILGVVGNWHCIPDLINAVRESHPVLRNEAISALGTLADSRAFEVLCESLNHDSYLTRMTAVSALGQLKDPRAVPVFVTLLQNENCDSLRYNIIEALGNIGDLGAIPVITSFSLDRNPQIRERAEIALTKLLR